jgi:TIR domain
MRIGLAVDNTLPLHIPSFVEFMEAHSKTLKCQPINTHLHFKHDKLDFVYETAQFTTSMRQEFATHDLCVLSTTKPFTNNYFYTEQFGLFIISFSDWHRLTTLPISNGLAYFLCQIISKHMMGIGGNHYDNTGCLNDFLWDKGGIDVCMRASFVCEECKTQSAANSHVNSQEFADVVSILNSVSSSSRKGIDILLDPSWAKPTQSPQPHFDAFLCHNSQDKPKVRELNEILRNAGIKCWFDEEQIKPGEVWQEKLEAAIPTIRNCLVIVGNSGAGPWQEIERRTFISEFANKGCKIIPVLIGNPKTLPELPLFLRQFMWSDLRMNDPSQFAKIIAVLKS